jgi:type II secretory pathway pseudopilin PulG
VSLYIKVFVKKKEKSKVCPPYTQRQQGRPFLLLKERKRVEEEKLMKNKKGFTLIALLIVASIIGLSALIGLRFYTGNQQGRTENTVFQEKAKDTIVQANVATIQSLLQAALADGDINRDEAVELAQNAGLQNPYNEEAMNTSECFPEIADAPDGLLPNTLTVKK